MDFVNKGLDKLNQGMEKINQNLEKFSIDAVEATAQPEYIQLKNRNLRKDRQIAEGGFGFVYEVTDTSTG